MSFKPSSVGSGPVVPSLTRPRLTEARRVRAAELFEQGRSSVDTARMLGVHAESVRRWKRVEMTQGWSSRAAPLLAVDSSSGGSDPTEKGGRANTFTSPAESSKNAVR
ncbi:transposase [Streptomyces chryseus]